MSFVLAMFGILRLSRKAVVGVASLPPGRLMPHTFCDGAPEGRHGVRKLAHDYPVVSAYSNLLWHAETTG